EVLHEVSFRSEPGTVTALVGPSGAGKSTIIGLIAAFYVPSSGRVQVDGVDLATVKLNSYRTQLGVVLQETFLFDGTIRENVAFARPNATEEEILAACQIARVDEFAESFDHKYDTVVGERGVKLSGGQEQRVSIARAILADPRILVLDKATATLHHQPQRRGSAGGHPHHPRAKRLTDSAPTKEKARLKNHAFLIQTNVVEALRHGAAHDQLLHGDGRDHGGHFADHGQDKALVTIGKR